MSCQKSYRDVKLQNAKCLLLQFNNEHKKPIQIGFQAWLKYNMDAAKQEILNKEVIIHWPLDVDITSAKRMEKKLRNRIHQDKDKWTDLPVKILAVGGTLFCSILYIEDIER